MNYRNKFQPNRNYGTLLIPDGVLIENRWFDSTYLDIKFCQVVQGMAWHGQQKNTCYNEIGYTTNIWILGNHFVSLEKHYKSTTIMGRVHIF